MLGGDGSVSGHRSLRSIIKHAENPDLTVGAIACRASGPPTYGAPRGVSTCGPHKTSGVKHTHPIQSFVLIDVRTLSLAGCARLKHGMFAGLFDGWLQPAGPAEFAPAWRSFLYWADHLVAAVLRSSDHPR